MKPYLVEVSCEDFATKLLIYAKNKKDANTKAKIKYPDGVAKKPELLKYI